MTAHLTLPRFSAVTLALGLSLLVVACQPYTLVEPKPTTLGSTAQVTPDIPWNRNVDGDYEHWTLNGPALDMVMVTRGVEDGDPIALHPRKVELPKFREDTTTLELPQLFQRTMSGLGAQNFSAEKTGATTLGGVPAVRIDFSYDTKDGLNRRGFTVLALREARLYMLAYSAAAVHYDGAVRPHARQLVESFTFL